MGSHRYGMFRIAAVSPSVSVANPVANTQTTIDAINDAGDVDVVLLPELGISGYSCGDLFASDSLLQASLEGLVRIREHSLSHSAIVAAGLPLVVTGSLMNVAAVIHQGRIAGIVPKTFLPTYREFYEGRYFRAASACDPAEVMVDGQAVPFGTDLIFASGDAVIAIDLCEDFWTPVPPSSYAAMAGANVLLNLSASNETIGKASWRRDLVRSQSGRCIAAYAYASAGPDESTSDLVYGGHCLIAENGSLLGESSRVGDGRGMGNGHSVGEEQRRGDGQCGAEGQGTTIAVHSIVQDVDLQRLSHDRRVIGSFDDMRATLPVTYRTVQLQSPTGTAEIGSPAQADSTESTDNRSRPVRVDLRREIDGQPFVPRESSELAARCAEIFEIQIAGLIKRLSQLPESLTLSIGVSGGLDSTLALLVAIRALDAMGRPRDRIVGLTMPGFGTTGHTRESADRLIEATRIKPECVDIRQLCLDTFRALNHSPLGIQINETTTVQGLQQALIQTPDDAADLTFENVQARVRTMLLMNRGFVIGTGDMSEQALGWSTYNADHMSMYNVNTSIPKTLVRFLVRYAADNHFGGELSTLLHRIADTPISPELMPPAADGTIRQATETSLGSYELHDFFLYHFVRNGFTREKILYLASHARFQADYSAETVAQTLEVFIRRFFANQFKRNCVPDGPKVGSVSLSPRGDWRMPSDADRSAF